MKNNRSDNQIIIYQGEGGQPSVQVRIENETVWLPQAKIVELFASSKANVSEHIKHIFEEGELQRDSVVRKFRTTAADGKNYDVEHYNLDMIISLGYRINSEIAIIRGTRGLSQDSFFELSIVSPEFANSTRDSSKRI